MYGDLGGTNFRLKINGKLVQLKTADFPSFYAALESILPPEPGNFFFLAVAGPVKEGKVRCSNLSHWGEISEKSICEKFGFKKTVLINDLHAAALALRILPLGETRLLAGPEKSSPGAKLLVGVGTGLGVSFLTFGGEALATEMGWATFAPKNKQESALVDFLGKKTSVESVTAGPAISRIFEFLGGKPGLTAEEIYKSRPFLWRKEISHTIIDQNKTSYVHAIL